MKTTWYSLAFLAAPLAAAPVATTTSTNASTPAAQQRGSLVRVPDDESRDGGERRAAFDRDEWKRKLGSNDLDARERDLDALVDLARDDREARRALEDWAHDKDAGELAWTARMALRQLDRPVPAPPRSLSRGGGPNAFPGFDDLQRRMEEMQRQFGGMDSMFEDMQREMRELLERRGNPATPRALPPGASSEQHGFRMQAGPDGVEVEVLEDVDGKQQSKTYKAKTIDELLEAHPELRGRISTDAMPFHGMRPRTPLAPLFGRGPSADDSSGPFQGDAKTLRPGNPQGEPSGDRLGIYCAPVGGDELKPLDEEHASGLRVESVVQNSLADLLGLRRGDVLVELDGQEIAQTDDVARVLRERDKKAELRAEVVDSQGHRRSLRYTPKSSAKASAAPRDAHEGKRF